MSRYAFCLWLSGLLFTAPLSADECEIPLSSSERSEPVWPALANATLSGVLKEPVTLRAGQYSSEPFVPGGSARHELQLWPELLLSADLDGKPGDEKIGLFSLQSGGSGTFIYLVATRMENGQSLPFPALLLGDRIQIRSLAVDQQKIILHTIEAGEGQPACCGTQQRVLTVGLHGNELALESREDEGEFSLAALQGTDWYLLDRPGDRLNAIHPSCTQVRFLEDAIELRIGETVYSIAIQEPTLGHIQLMPPPSLSSTELSPPRRLLRDLTHLTQYQFRAGRLLLSGVVEGREIRFEFAPLYVNTSIAP